MITLNITMDQLFSEILRSASLDDILDTLEESAKQHYTPKKSGKIKIKTPAAYTQFTASPLQTAYNVAAPQKITPDHILETENVINEMIDKLEAEVEDGKPVKCIFCDRTGCTLSCKNYIKYKNYITLKNK